MVRTARWKLLPRVVLLLLGGRRSTRHNSSCNNPDFSCCGLPRHEVNLKSESVPPCRRAAIAAAAEMLAAEAAAHSDLVVVRGADAYRNLPNKTVRLLRYMLSSARGCARLGACACHSKTKRYKVGDVLWARARMNVPSGQILYRSRPLQVATMLRCSAPCMSTGLQSIVSHLAS